MKRCRRAAPRWTGARSRGWSGAGRDGTQRRNQARVWGRRACRDQHAGSARPEAARPPTDFGSGVSKGWRLSRSYST